MKLREFKYYTCISCDPKKCELLGDTQNPDVWKTKYSLFAVIICDSCSAPSIGVHLSILKQQ